VRAVTNIGLIGGILASRRARGILCGILVLQAVAFARAPFAQWIRGEITAIDPAAATFSLHEAASEKILVFHCDAETRLWREPVALRDTGRIFDPKELTIGAQVRVMFKKQGDQNRATRVIRVAASAEKSAKKK
jgi:hypothetical protein